MVQQVPSETQLRRLPTLIVEPHPLARHANPGVRRPMALPVRWYVLLPAGCSPPSRGIDSGHDGASLTLSSTVTSLALLGGLYYFRRVEQRFADVV